MGLSFERLSVVNMERCARWHPGFPRDGVWTGADWSNAMCGEAGEAANIVKKLRRLETRAFRTAVVEKFNIVSARQGFPERL